MFCLKKQFLFLKVHQGLELENLTEDQIDEILGTLTVSVAHLNTHSKIVKEEIEQ